jgi:iron complex outermembrane receptor protein
MFASTSVTRAVRHALLASATAMIATPLQAQSQSTPTENIQEIVVTGSRIRRVDEETASPVFVLDNTAITSSGVQTLGDLLQRTPSVAGAATNPQVNNGGGTGESNVELRGLGAQRTLVLLNGRRIGILGNTTTSAVDVNMIPINMIERVEVLKEGAGAVYGSDAIAGVVNFITKKNIDGAEISLEMGETGESDGENQSASLTLGTSTDNFNVIVGGNWNKQEGVSANDRDFSANALYLYGGVVSQGGSSRTPNGRINLDAALEEQYGCSSVTRIAGASGAGLGDYRCYTGADAYNYQPFNLLMTPQERGSLFTILNYDLNDSISLYTEIVYNQTRSGFQIAPLPFDATQDDTVISADSIYNPFGIDFGGIESGNANLRSRLEALGNRQSEVHTNQTLVNAGLRGELPGDWQWDVNAGLGYMDQDQNISGYLLGPQLKNAVGPSFFDADGIARCGAPGAVIAGCTPINLFNVNSPEQVALLQAIQTNYRTDYQYRSQSYSANANGELFDMPAGPVLAAVGFEYRTQQGEFTNDVLTRGEPPLFLSCLLAQETCTGNSFAKYNVRELYTEFFVPVLSDLPGVNALNVTAGVRYSDYSKDSIGDDTNAQFKIEYRPISDVLIRGSYAQVFRAPTIVDLSLAPTQNAPTFTDPCEGIVAADVAANPNLAQACVGVPLDGTFAQPLSQITGLFTGNDDLKPETGDVTTFGIVYDVSQVPGLSFTVDYWDYHIEDIITNLDVNFTATQCAQTGDPAFCGLIYRYEDPTSLNAGLIKVMVQPTVNLGELNTDGIDFSVKYGLRDTAAGDFTFSLDATHINSYESIASEGAPPQEVAGTFDRQFGNYAKWRGMLGIGWGLGDVDAMLTVRYIDSVDIIDPDGAPGVQPNLTIPDVTYFDLNLGYTFATDTRVQLGAINLGDKDPPILYQNNVLNANTDVSTYDTLGRRWYVGVTQKF